MVLQESLHGDKASWFNRSWAIKAESWNSFHTTNTYSWTNIYYNSILCRFCTSERKSLPWPLLDSLRAFSRARNAVCQVWGRTGLKTRVKNNLLATFCLHFTRTLFHCVLRSHLRIQSALTQYFRYALCKLVNTWHNHTTRMGPTPKGSSALQHFERGNPLEIRKGIMFDFYPGLPQLLLATTMTKMSFVCL